MSNNFNIEIISPEKSIIKSETNEVTLPAYEGQIGILKDVEDLNLEEFCDEEKLAPKFINEPDEENNSYEDQTLSDGEYCRKRVNERRENLQLSHIYTETIIKKFLYKNGSLVYLIEKPKA